MGYRIVYFDKTERSIRKKNWIFLLTFGTALLICWGLSRIYPQKWIMGDGIKVAGAIEAWAENVYQEEEIEEIIEAFCAEVFVRD